MLPRRSPGFLKWCTGKPRQIFGSEVIVHSSVHPFKNASILETMVKSLSTGCVIIQSISVPARSAGGWNRPSRYGTNPAANCVLMLQVQQPQDNWNEKAENTKAGFSCSESSPGARHTALNLHCRYRRAWRIRRFSQLLSQEFRCSKRRIF